MEDELDNVKREILKLLSEKTKFSQENETLRRALLSDVMPSLPDSDQKSPNVSKRSQDRSSPDGQVGFPSNEILLCPDISNSKFLGGCLIDEIIVLFCTR